MESQVIFRPYQEQTSDDHNNLQDFTRQSLDHVVLDIATESRRYAGFGAQKTAQAEIQIAAGRFYDVFGAVYFKADATVQSMLTYLPVVAERIISVVVTGSEAESDIETRDYLVDIDTQRMEPRSVSTTRSRNAVISLVSGTESADPQAPATPVGSVLIATVRLDSTSVVSVTQNTAAQVQSTEELDVRQTAMEVFKTIIEPRVLSLASDLSALTERVNKLGQGNNISLVRVYQDLARLKRNADLPQDYSQYGDDTFLSDDLSDTTDSAGLGYDAQISNGLSFAAANQDESELSLFSANDPNASLSNGNGVLLPKYDSQVKLRTSSDLASTTSMSQYGYQTFNIVHRSYTSWRLRYGPWWWYYYPYPAWYYYVYGLYPALAWSAFYPWIVPYYSWAWPYYVYYWWPYYWYEAFTVTYDETEVTNHSIQGAQVAQTFLIANDVWATRLGFYISAKGADENIFLTLCETTNGMPDISKSVMHMSYPYQSITVGWNRTDIPPTFMKRGSRYALVVTSNVNHQVGMAAGEDYIDGTFFYSTDGAYYLGDLTKDMMLELWGAVFNSSQVTIEMAPINLDGGIRSIDLWARGVNPDSTEMIWEVRPSGAGDWIPLDKDHLTALTGAPPLFQLRGRFVGTRDMMPGVVVTGSRLAVARPKQVFKHVSDLWTLDTPSSVVAVQVMLGGFDETPHDCTVRLYANGGYVSNDGVSTETIDADTKTYKRVYHFTIPSPSVSNFRIVIDGTTTSPANLFTVTELLWWVPTA